MKQVQNTYRSQATGMESEQSYRYMATKVFPMNLKEENQSLLKRLEMYQEKRQYEGYQSNYNMDIS